MGDRDERLGPSPFTFPPQRRRTVLRDDPVRQRAWARHRRAGLQGWNDPGDGAVAPRRRQRDDRRAAARTRGAEDEIELAADPRDLTRPQALRRHLAGQVDLERGVDRDEAVEPRHYLR